MRLNSGRKNGLLWAVSSIMVGICSLFLGSCGGSDTSDLSLREAKGGRFYGGVYRMNESDGIRTLDPVQLNDAPSHHVVHQIADLLVDFDSTLHLQPELAESWSVSDDGLIYTYKLRSGVRFHDNDCFPGGKGRAMTAADVKYCFDRILDARSGSKGADYFRDKVKGAAAYYSSTLDTSGGATVAPEGVEGFVAVDDRTFQIHLVTPFPAFKFYPALGMGYIYPREAVEKYGKDFSRNLVGTGPFVLKKWAQDRELVLERNPNYWRKDEAGNQLPYLDSVYFTFMKDQSTVLNEFKQGNLEENYRIPNEYIENVFEPREPGTNAPWTPQSEYEEFTIHRTVELSSQYYGMLNTDPIFKDKRIRQAFNYAIDRERIIEFVLRGQAAGPAHHGLVPPSMPDYPIESVKGYEFDPKKAQDLLADAGFAGGRGFPAVTLQYNEGGGRNTTIAEAIQEELRKNLGITINTQALQFAQHLDKIDAGQTNFYRLGWIADYPDPENFLNLLWGKNAAPLGQISPINSTRYNNPAFDELFEKALVTEDVTERMKLFAQAEQIAVDDAPMLWIVYDMQFRLVQPWVKGYSSNAMDRRDLTGVWFDDGSGGSGEDS